MESSVKHTSPVLSTLIRKCKNCKYCQLFDFIYNFYAAVSLCCNKTALSFYKLLKNVSFFALLLLQIER